MEIPNDLVPHGIIFDIRWEIHPRLSDGKYAGRVVEKNRVVFDIKANNLPLALEYTKSILESIKRNAKDVSTIEIEEERVGETHFQGTPNARSSSSPLLGMRGSLGPNSPR